VTPGQAGTGPNLGGDVVAYASRMTSALYVGLPYAGHFSLRSHVIEPVVGTFPGANALTLTVNDPPLKNCLTTNAATPTCGATYLAQFDPANKANPFDQFDCHLKIYAALANGTSGSGTTRGSTPWPENYQPTTGGSINDPNVRRTGIYLTTGGRLGTALAPMYGWTAAKPC